MICSCEVFPLFGDHRLGEEAEDSEGPRQTAHYRETEQQTRGLTEDCYVCANAQIYEIKFFKLV